MCACGRDRLRICRGTFGSAKPEHAPVLAQLSVVWSDLARAGYRQGAQLPLSSWPPPPSRFQHIPGGRAE